ncbi:MAG TPA: cbb3-type cytochrome c oxidase subunit I, partial [Opitutaceae bacterium]|nr:cbb3-type cytochrome c oxidase subunit I [Opitutaceae bacterium]
FNASFAIGLWLLARLSRGLVVQPALLVVAGLFWNLGVTLGVVGIAIGHGTSLDGFEMPGYVGPILFLAYIFIAIWSVLTYKAGRSEQVYISQWYILAALFWFPWIFSIAQIMLFIDPTRGTVQSIVQTWFSQGLYFLWFLPVGLGAIYYFLPKLLSRTIPNYYLSVYGFWTLALVGGWAGMSRLTGGPVPAWVVSAGVAAMIMLVVTLLIVGVNFLPLLFGGSRSAAPSPALRFIAFGSLAVISSLVVGIILSLRGVAEVAQFTYLQTAQAQLVFYAFFSMIAFGAIYYLLPRVLGVEWRSPGLIGAHFWLSALGALLGIVALALAGVKQGYSLNVLPLGQETPVPFLTVTQQLLPYLSAQTLAATVLLLGHLVFGIHVMRTLCASCCLVKSSASVPSYSAKEAVIR